MFTRLTQEETVTQNTENKSCENGVLAIALHEGKVEHRGKHAHVWRQHQRGDPEIDKDARAKSAREHLSHVREHEVEQIHAGD